MLGTLQEWEDFCHKRMSEKPSDKNLQAVTLSKGGVKDARVTKLLLWAQCVIRNFMFLDYFSLHLLKPSQ